MNAIEHEEFKIIDETNKYILGCIWEEPYLYDKINRTEIFLCKFYGQCDSGAINDEDDWCVAGGDIIAIWKNGELRIIDREELKWVNSIRIKNRNIIEILTDPWSNNAAIWELNIQNISFNKISDFSNYKDKPYTDKVEW
jgi:hypothetical protein